MDFLIEREEQLDIQIETALRELGMPSLPADARLPPPTTEVGFWGDNGLTYLQGR